MKTITFDNIQLEIINSALKHYLTYLQESKTEINISGEGRHFLNDSIQWKLGALNELTN
jgi:hypothetical protein